jgi:hypothetical protein
MGVITPWGARRLFVKSSRSLFRVEAGTALFLVVLTQLLRCSE